MHKDDMRRFCVVCSVKDGKLVRVVSVKKATAQEKKATARVQRTIEKQIEKESGSQLLREAAKRWPGCLDKRWSKLKKDIGRQLPAHTYVPVNRAEKIPDRSSMYHDMLAFVAYLGELGNAQAKKVSDQRKHDAMRKLLRDQADDRPWLPAPVIKIDLEEGRVQVIKYIRTYLAPTYLAEDLGADPQSDVGHAIAAAAQADAWDVCDRLAEEHRKSTKESA
jgi:hypothetical protein